MSLTFGNALLVVGLIVGAMVLLRWRAMNHAFVRSRHYAVALEVGQCPGCGEGVSAKPAEAYPNFEPGPGLKARMKAGAVRRVLCYECEGCDSFWATVHTPLGVTGERVGKRSEYVGEVA